VHFPVGSWILIWLFFSTWEQVLTPTVVTKAPRDVIAVAAGGAFSAVLTKTGQVFVVGYTVVGAPTSAPRLSLDFVPVSLDQLDSRCVRIAIGGDFVALVHMPFEILAVLFFKKFTFNFSGR
jgi:alpha-tubulin suppressor-like RCC1 family protein